MARVHRGEASGTTDWLGFTAARRAAYTHQHDCLRAITEFVVCSRREEVAPGRSDQPARSGAGPRRRREGKQPARPASEARDLEARVAAAERAAAELIAEEDAKQRAHERRARRAKARSKRRGRAAAAAAAATAVTSDEEENLQQEGGGAPFDPGSKGAEPPSGVPPEDGDALREPPWLARLLDEYKGKMNSELFFTIQ